MPPFELSSISPFRTNKRSPEHQWIWISSITGYQTPGMRGELIPYEREPPNRSPTGRTGAHETRRALAPRCDVCSARVQATPLRGSRTANTPGPEEVGAQLGGGMGCGRNGRGTAGRSLGSPGRPGTGRGRPHCCGAPREAPGSGPSGRDSSTPAAGRPQAERPTEAGPWAFGPARILPW